MKGKIFTTGAFLTLVLLTLNGCTASVSTSSGKPNTATANSNSASANSTAKANSNTAAKKPGEPAAPSEKLRSATKPQNEKGKVAKNTEVPKDWITIYDEKKGYSFSLPDGSTGGQDNAEGTDIFVAQTPAPSDLAVAVLSFNDRKMTKEDLMTFAVEFMKGLGATKVEPGKLTAESADYSITEVVATLADGSNSKSKVLVGMDVSDNYVMIVGTEEPKFAANEKVIDEIWGSFEMWSGGASGE